jgi:hypothetical protein
MGVEGWERSPRWGNRKSPVTIALLFLKPLRVVVK